MGNRDRARGAEAAPTASDASGPGAGLVHRLKAEWGISLAIVVFLAMILVVIILLVVHPPWENEPLPAVQARLQTIQGPELEAEKLRQEILKLDLENRNEGSFWGLFLSYIPFLTAIVAGAGVFATIWKQITERARQQQLDRSQREAESQRRFDTNFTNVVQNLGSASPALQATAAISLTTFLKPEYHTFHDQVFLVILANLKTPHDAAVNDLLVRVFEQAIRTRLPSAAPEDRRYLLDLSRTRLDRVDFSQLDLSEADLGYASMRYANLTGANLRRVRGIEVELEKARLSRSDLSEGRLRKARCRGAQFQEANLMSARLEEAELQGAQFQKARLQSAHLNAAHLGGARFEGANVNDAFFVGAFMDEVTLKSIATGARNWQNAHFDPDIEARLGEISRASP